MSERIDKLFIDLDENIISSIYANNVHHANQLIETYSQHWEGWKYFTSEGIGWDTRELWYVTFIRPWTREFLKWCHETYGRENVHFLTMGTADYIFKMISVLELDIDLKNVHTREDIYYPKHNFDNFNNVLVDNENYLYHSLGELNKVNFLGGIPKDKLVQVNQFNVRYHDPENDEGYLEHVKERITNSFEWKYEN